MSQPYVGEIRAFAFQRTPTGWFPCDGRLLSIADYQVLYTLLGTTYGGDGVTTFGLPDLRGRTPIHWGNLAGGGTYVLGQKAGTETVTLTTQQIPAHNHTMTAANTAATTITPGAAVLPATVTSTTLYLTTPGGPTAAMSAQAVVATGGNGAHENCAPTLTMSFCISAFGVYPSQN